jgi:molybdopterin-containing oxidoreductase family iron-sulfur binding subunit
MAATERGTQQDRREFLEKLATAIFAGVVAPVVLGTQAVQAEATTVPELPSLPEPQPNEDPLIRMMRDLQRALQKPMAQRRWVMVIDLRKCVGCHACTIACVVETNSPRESFTVLC